MLKPRRLTPIIISHLNSHEIIFLLGTRQTGKTTLCKLVAEDSGFDKKSVFFFDLEDKEYRKLFNTVSVQLLKNIFMLEGVDPSSPALLIFDEIQLLEDPANLLKLLHDHFPVFRVIATGSSTLSIKHKFSDSLAGRKRVFPVEPLTFDEFLIFKDEGQLVKIRSMYRSQPNEDLLPLLQSYGVRLLNIFEEYLIFGGYPEVVMLGSREEKIEKLNSIATSYIQKDIREFGNIENIDAYNDLLKYLAVNLGAHFNLSSAMSTIKLSAPTLRKYISLLQETFIIKELPPYFVNKNKEISKNKKIYFKDTGIRNLQIKNFTSLDLRSDAGSIYENYVFNVLDQRKEIETENYFYRTQNKTEIDFVVFKNQKIKLIEVKSGNFNRPVKAMKEFQKKYSGQCNHIKKYVVNRSKIKIDPDFHFIPAYLF